MATELKTKPTDESVEAFIDSVENDRRRSDAKVLLKLFTEVTGEKAVLWGNSIIGFGTYSYKTKSGCAGDWMVTGFSPRKQSMSIYLMCGVDSLQKSLDALGKHKAGKGCIYVNNLDDIDLSVLKELIVETVAEIRKNYP